MAKKKDDNVVEVHINKDNEEEINIMIDKMNTVILNRYKADELTLDKALEALFDTAKLAGSLYVLGQMEDDEDDEDDDNE